MSVEELYPLVLEGDAQAALKYFYLTSAFDGLDGDLSRCNFETDLGPVQVTFTPIKCFFCYKMSRKRCRNCNGRGRFQCKTCRGYYETICDYGGCEECDYPSELVLQEGERTSGFHYCKDCDHGRQNCTKCQRGFIPCPACGDTRRSRRGRSSPERLPLSHPEVLLISLWGEFKIGRRSLITKAQCFYHAPTHSYIKIKDFLASHWDKALFSKYARQHGNITVKQFNVDFISKITPYQRRKLTAQLKKHTANLLYTKELLHCLSCWSQRDRVGRIYEDNENLVDATEKLDPLDKKFRKVIAKELSSQGIPPTRNLVDRRYDEILAGVPQLQYEPDDCPTSLGYVNIETALGWAGVQFHCACNGTPKLQLTINSGEAFSKINRGSKYYLVGWNEWNDDIYSSWSRIDLAKKAKRKLKRDLGISTLLVMRPKNSDSEFGSFWAKVPRGASRQRGARVWVDPSEEENWVTSFNNPWFIESPVSLSAYTVSASLAYKDIKKPKKWELDVERSPEDETGVPPYPTEVKLIKSALRSALVDLWEFDETKKALDLCKKIADERLAMKVKLYHHIAISSERNLGRRLIEFYRNKEALFNEMKLQVEKAAFIPMAEDESDIERFRQLDLSENLDIEVEEEGSPRLLSVLLDVFGEGPEETEEQRIGREESMRQWKEEDEKRIRRLDLD